MLFAPKVPKEFKEYNSVREKKLRYAFCHAPENTLRFSLSGQVHICCRNRYFIAGKYPENTIQEIWNSVKIEEFRKRLKKFDLSYGCQFCEQHFRANNLNFVKALDYDIFQHDKKKILRKLELELSNTCNLQYIMCSGELSSEISRCSNERASKMIYDEKFVEELKPYLKKIERITYSGGEPLLIKLYYTIWEESLTINPSIEHIIITNGTILNEKFKQIIARGKFFFSVSIDSFNKNTFEKIRKNAVFEKVMDNFEYFYNYSEQNKRWITINVCPITLNRFEIPKMVDDMNKRNISVYFNHVDYPIFLSLRSLNINELSELYNFYEEYNFKNISTPVFQQNIRNFRALKIFIKTLINEKQYLKHSTIKNIKTKEEAISFMIDTFVRKFSHFAHQDENKHKAIEKIIQSIEIINDEKTVVDGVKYFCQLPDYLMVGEIVFSTVEGLARRISKKSIDLGC